MTDPAQQPDPTQGTGSQPHLPLGRFTAEELKKREQAIDEIDRTTDQERKDTLTSRQLRHYHAIKKIIEAKEAAGDKSPELAEEKNLLGKWAAKLKRRLDDMNDSRGYVGGA